MIDCTIRKATIADADGIGACLDAAYAHYAAHIGDLPDMSADGAGQISENDVWVAESETRGHGFSEMQISTHVQMLETIGLYARNGWVEIGRQGNKVEMRKVLSG